MDNREIFNIARIQSAADINCRPEDFLKTDHVIISGRAKGLFYAGILSAGRKQASGSALQI